MKIRTLRSRVVGSQWLLSPFCLGKKIATTRIKRNIGQFKFGCNSDQLFISKWCLVEKGHWCNGTTFNLRLEGFGINSRGWSSLCHLIPFFFYSLRNLCAFSIHYSEEVTFDKLLLYATGITFNKFRKSSQREQFLWINIFSMIRETHVLDIRIKKINKKKR